MIPASPESYDFQPSHTFGIFQKIKTDFLLVFIFWKIFHCQARREEGRVEQGIGRTSEGADDYCKQVETSNPFFFSSTLRFFAKKGFFSILWAGPLKNDHFSSIAETGTYWPI